MAASRLTLLLVSTFVSIISAESVDGSSPSLQICGASTCLFRNGTQCDRMTQECPRCVMYDPLLNVLVCTNVQSGGKCLGDSTLCPVTPLEPTEPSDSGYHWMPLNATAPSIQPVVESANASSLTAATAGTLSMKASHSPVPTWALIVGGAVLAAVAMVLSVVMYRNKRLAKLAQEPRTPPPMPLTPNGNECGESFMTLHDNSPSFDDAFLERMVDFKPSTAPTAQLSDLAFSHGTGSYQRQSSVYDMAGFMDNERVSIDHWWEVDSRVGVDDIALLEADMAARFAITEMDDDDVDIYPDTARGTMHTERGPMFSPKSQRGNVPPDFATLSVDDGEYSSDGERNPETSVPDTRSRSDRSTAPEADSDFVDRISYLELPEDPQPTRQQQRLTKWRAHKYQNHRG